MTPPAFSFLFPVALHDTCLPVFHRVLREHAFQVGGVNILRNFFVLFLVFLFYTPASGALEATAELHKTPVFCNEPVIIVITVSWRGQRNDYQVGIPRIVLPEGIVRTGVSSRSVHDGETFRIVYTYRLQVPEPGTFSIDAVEVEYQVHDKEEAVTKRIPGFSLVVEKRGLLNGLVGWFFVAGTGAFVAGVLFLGWVRHREYRDRRSNNPGSLTNEETITFQDRLEHCRKLKTFGDLERFFEEAFKLQQEIFNRLPKTDRTDRTGEGFARLADQVKYGGAKPSSAEIEACFRALERLVQNVLNR